jgi:RecA-family ATPase
LLFNCIIRLFAAGANINAVNHCGQTPLDSAVAFDQKDNQRRNKLIKLLNGSRRKNPLTDASAMLLCHPIIILREETTMPITH